MANQFFQNFVNNLKGSAQQNPIQAGMSPLKTTGVALGKTLFGSKPNTPKTPQMSMVPASNSATGTDPTKITPPTGTGTGTVTGSYTGGSSSAGSSGMQDYISSLTGNQPPASNPQSVYLEYLRSQFDPNKVNQAQTGMNTANQRLANIQSQTERQSLAGQHEQERLLDESGVTTQGAQQSANMARRRTNAELADLAVQESAASRSAQVAKDVYDQYINAGKTIYEAEQAAAKAQREGGFTLGKDEVRYDAQGNILAKGVGDVAAQQQQGYRVNAMNNINQYIDTALAQVNKTTTGLGGLLSVIPGTAAKDLKSTLTTIKANIGFEALQAMREASKTGGALGQVAVQELEALQATLGSLDQKQSTEQLITNLNSIKQHYQNAINTLNQANGGQTQQTTYSSASQIPDTPPNGATFRSDTGETYIFQNGVWVQSFNQVGGGTKQASNVTSLEDAKNRIARNESRGSGGYLAVGPVVTKGQYKGERALGKYQVMPGNIGPWSRELLGREITPQQFYQNPQLQEQLVGAKMAQLYQKYGNWGDVASAWFTGGSLQQGANRRDVTGTSGAQYVKKFYS